MYKIILAFAIALSLHAGAQESTPVRTHKFVAHSFVHVLNKDSLRADTCTVYFTLKIYSDFKAKLEWTVAQGTDKGPGFKSENFESSERLFNAIQQMGEEGYELASRHDKYQDYQYVDVYLDKKGAITMLIWHTNTPISWITVFRL
jgi:hypothetical protein